MTLTTSHVCPSISAAGSSNLHVWSVYEIKDNNATGTGNKQVFTCVNCGMIIETHK